MGETGFDCLYRIENQGFQRATDRQIAPCPQGQDPVYPVFFPCPDAILMYVCPREALHILRITGIRTSDPVDPVDVY